METSVVFLFVISLVLWAVGMIISWKIVDNDGAPLRILLYFGYSVLTWAGIPWYWVLAVGVCVVLASSVDPDATTATIVYFVWNLIGALILMALFAVLIL